MATLKELMGDLTRGDGRKFRKLSWSGIFYFEPIFKEIDNLWFGLNQHGMAEDYFEDDYKYWEPHNESKPKNKVKMYSPIYRNDSGIGYFMKDRWSSSKSDFDPLTIKPIVGWQEMEVEVNE